MSFLLPEAGLLFWMLIAFGIVFLVLYRYGFPVITNMIDGRKQFIDNSLRKAREANEKLDAIKRQGDELLNAAHEEQAKIMRETLALRDGIMNEAREKAEAESAKLLEEARMAIAREKDDAMREISAQVAEISLAIAEKIIRRELSGDKAQEEYVKELVNEAMKEKISAK